MIVTFNLILFFFGRTVCFLLIIVGFLPNIFATYGSMRLMTSEETNAIKIPVIIPEKSSIGKYANMYIDLYKTQEHKICPTP